jgi:uncharacterized membrane protein
MKFLAGHHGRDATGRSSPGDICRSRGARVLLAAGVVAYMGFYLTWALHNYNHFGTFGFDLGIHDQAVWLLSRGHSPFITISGANYFGDHLSFIMLAVVPLYWLFPSAQVLLVLQALALGLAAVPAFLIAREKLRSERLAGVIAWAYLLNPYVGWINLDQFHPDAFEVPLVFLAFWFAVRRRWRGFFVTIVLMMLVKEDAPLLVLGLGVWVALLYDRRVGIRSTALGALWLFVNFKFLLPVLSGTGSLAEYVSTHTSRIPFGGLVGFLRTLVTKPWRVVSYAFGSGRPLYYLQVFAPVGFLPWLSPSTLAAVILPLVANGLSTFWYQHSLHYHYGTLVAPSLMVAAIFGIARGSPRLRWRMVGFMVVAAMVSMWLWGPAPGSRDPGPWAQRSVASSQAAQAAMSLIPPDAVVSVDFSLVTHLDHRVEIYEFPTPFLSVNWGDRRTTGESLAERAATVEYVLLSQGMNAQSRTVFERLTASGELNTIFDQEGWVLLARAVPYQKPPLP